MRVVILDEELPFPLNSGKRIRTGNLVARLARRHEIEYVCYPPDDFRLRDAAKAHFEQLGVAVRYIDDRLPPNRGPAFAARLLRNLASPRPYSVQKHVRGRLLRLVSRIAEENPPDLWHCEWTPYAAACAGRVSQPWVLMAHNVESLIWRRFYENAKNPLKRRFLRQQWRKFASFERDMFAATDRLVTVSAEDAALARREFSAGDVRVVDNGVDIGYFHPEDRPRSPRELLFLGSLDWFPNQDAGVLLLEEILPRLRARFADASLTVVGRRPPAWLSAKIAATPGAALVADAPDVRPYLWRCAAAVVPLRIGGGSRLKILEALAAKCPVVSTKIGAEGLDLAPAEHFILAKDGAPFADAVAEHVYGAPARLAEITRAGHEKVIREYHWDALADKLDAVWTETARLPSAAPEVALR